MKVVTGYLSSSAGLVQIEAGSRSDEVVSQVDFAATFAEISGYELSNEVAIDSYNILPVLLGRGIHQPDTKGDGSEYE